MKKSKAAETPSDKQADDLAATLAELDREEADLRKLIADDGATQEAKLTAVQRSFRARKEQESKRFQQQTDSEYWFCVCFMSREQKEYFLKALNWFGFGDKYIDGVDLASTIDGMALPDADLRFIMEKGDRRLSEISLPLPRGDV